MDDSFGVVGLAYMYLARPVLDGYGLKGEIAIRKGLREYGKFRGQQMREWHTRERLPINVETLIRFWDNGYAYLTPEFAGAEYISKEQNERTRIYKPYEERHTETTCPAFNYWRDEGWQRFGYFYCDEIHQEITKAYKPNAIVEIHENMNKGDPFCSFAWMSPPEGEVPSNAYDEIRRRIRGNPALFYRQVLGMTVRMVGSVYYFLAKAIDESLGNSDVMIQRSLRELGAKMGSIAKERIGRQESPSLHSILDALMLPYGVTWDHEIRDETLVVRSCPLAGLWRELGDIKFGPLYCRETYGPMLQAFSLKTRISECISCGNERCVIHISK